MERMPSAFREQYFSLFAGPEPETLHPDLYQRLIDDGTNLILDHIKEYNRTRKELLKRMGDKIKVEQLECDEELASNRVVASDAGNNGVDLRSTFAPLYASTGLAAEGWTIIDEPICRAGKPEIWPNEPKAKEREAMLASKIQFDVTREAVDKWKPKLVTIDGPIRLYFSLIASTRSSNDYAKDFKDTIASAVSLLQTCSENDIPLVGFVKRTRRNQICRSFGMPQLRDTALLDLILRLGQYTPPEPKPMGGPVAGYYRKTAKKMDIPDQKIKEITNIHSFYIRTGLTTPFRLEVPEYCIDRSREIGTILFTTSEEDGIPFAIHEADQLTRITTSLSNIRTLMLYSKALDLVKTGEMDPEDLNLLALQHGETWTLRDDNYWSNTLTQGKE